jgi:hypothetical protein
MTTQSRLSQRPRIFLWALPVLLFIMLLPVLGHFEVDRYTDPLIGKTTGKVIFTTLFALLLVLPFIRNMRYTGWRKRIISEILERGEAAEAVITSIEQTGVKRTDGVDERWRVELVLDIKRSSGESHSARTDCFISTIHLPQYQPGKAVQVKINPDNREEVVIIGLE